MTTSHTATFKPTVHDTHKLLHFNHIPGCVTDSTPLTMREAATYGHIFAGRLDEFEGQPKSVFDIALSTELLRHTSVNDNDAGALLLRIAFLVRAVETVRDPSVHKIEGYRPHTMSIMAQHAITIAKLGLKPDVIDALWSAHDVVGVDGAEWRKTLTGAFRVAAVAERLSIDSFGWRRPVYLPTVDEDRAKIDLLVTNGLGQGITLQVKAHEEEGIRLAKIVGEPCGGVLQTRDMKPDGTESRQQSERNMPDYGMCRQLWKSTQEFNTRHDLAFEPVIAYVGR